MKKPPPSECSKSEFARLLGCDASLVSRWVTAGRLVMTDRGLVQVMPSLRRLLVTADPARGGRGGSQLVNGTSTVARIEELLAEATESGKEARTRETALHARVAELESELAAERDWTERRATAAKFGAEEEADRSLKRFTAALASRFDEACDARAAGRLRRWLEELVAVEFYRRDLDEFRRDFPEEDDSEPDVIDLPTNPGTPGRINVNPAPDPSPCPDAEARAQKAAAHPAPTIADP